MPQDPATDAPPRAVQRPDKSFKRPVIIRFHGSIDGRMGRYFQGRLAKAQKRGADLIVLDIDSPGGYLSTSLEIAEALSGVDWAHTVAYVSREAISGAALVSLGCDEIIMAPDSRIGDAGAIQFDPELFAFVYVEAKAKSYLVRQARDLAEANGHPPDLAQAMVDQDFLVFRPKSAPAGRSDFKTAVLSGDEKDTTKAAQSAGIDLDAWELIPESGPDLFFTVNNRRATELGLASHSAASRDEMENQFNVEGPWTEYFMTSTDTAVYLLNLPLITFLLFVIGVVALYFELASPGIGVGGLLAGFCAVLFFWSRFMGGTSGWLEVLLFLMGIVFLGMELFVIPGWGISGIIGLLLLLTSAVLAGQSFVVPRNPHQWNELVTTILVILCSGCVVLIAAGWISKRVGALPIVNRLILRPPAGDHETENHSDAEKKPNPVAHPTVSVGDWGRTESPLCPAGRARFGHRSVEVISDGSYIETGRAVRVVDISGHRVLVIAVEDSPPA
jgi:membrane-bound serine protease (ClpP class)